MAILETTYPSNKTACPFYKDMLNLVYCKKYNVLVMNITNSNLFF